MSLYIVLKALSQLSGAEVLLPFPSYLLETWKTEQEQHNRAFSSAKFTAW